ncbi:MAG: 3-oxoacyl-[acyl-carrier-protein] reductase [Chitinophagales bacterium]|nr:3-oxoacyl-[acyl-carrier-protein] reductase [Chitinophagales bacterium]
MLLKDKTALISGGSRGIGEAIVRAFVAQGAKVVFTFNNAQDKAELIVQELGADNVQAVKCDVTQKDEVLNAINSSIQFLGEIDILVNNAGVTKDNLLLRMSDEDWDIVMDTNLKATYWLSKSVLKYMLKSGGAIINISSIMGIYGNQGQANYAASKSAIIGLSKSIAKEYGSRNIRCNVIAPGWINTDMTEQLDESSQKEFQQSIALQRIGQPEEVAQVAVFLASQMSSYITGQVLQVCGGVK